MVHHGWFMIDTWLCIMFVDLSIWEGRYVSNESRLVLMIFWRLCCVDRVVRLEFSRWCLLTWKLILSTPWCRKTPCTLMRYKMRQFFWRAKDFVGIIFQSYEFVFKIDGFLGLWQDVAGKFLQPLESGLLTSKSSQGGLDSQWEGWQSSKQRENSGSAAARE